MAKARQSDNFAAYMLIVVICAILCVAMVWMYFDYKQRTASYVAYASFGPMVVRGSDFSIRATISVQTSNGDLSWVEKHKKAVNFALQSALAAADPVRARAPDGVTYVQDMLHASLDQTLGTRAVQDILLTDFIIQKN